MQRPNLPQFKWNIIFFAIALMVMAVDQLSKLWVRTHLVLDQSVP